ncbi:phosphotransferase [Actinoplanes sp. CA-030573]|uniref:phosphotransferase n=1 Tax=Actinoplanes sp. CA-030573 TaxID=3239898 RepID=UPI003D8ADE5F
MRQVGERFGLGAPVAEPVPVAGGLSNELWRVATATGVYAVKRMIVNAGRPDFRDNVEASYAIERRAWAAGVPMPEPVPDPETGTALAEVDGSLYRVHRWVEGTPAAGSGDEAAALLRAIHAAGHPRVEPAPVRAWAGGNGAGGNGAAGTWGLGRLGGITGGGPARLVVVDSHRDLDRKNMLRTVDGVLMALDWDAAGPVAAVYEAAALAFDWSDGDPEVFAATARAYGDVPAEPWIFAGLVAGEGGWLDYNLAHGRADEVERSVATLRRLLAGWEELLAALSR